MIVVDYTSAQCLPETVSDIVSKKKHEKSESGFKKCFLYQFLSDVKIITWWILSGVNTKDELLDRKSLVNTVWKYNIAVSYFNADLYHKNLNNRISMMLDWE